MLLFNPLETGDTLMCGWVTTTSYINGVPNKQFIFYKFSGTEIYTNKDVNWQCTHVINYNVDCMQMVNL